MYHISALYNIQEYSCLVIMYFFLNRINVLLQLLFGCLSSYQTQYLLLQDSLLN